MKPKFKVTLVLAILFFASLFLRVWWLDAGKPLFGDEPDYNFLAGQIIEGKGFVDEKGEPTAWRTPGFPVFLASIYKICGTKTSSTRIVLTVFSAFTPVIIFLFSFFLFKNESIALISGIGWAILPTNILLSGNLLGESIAALLIVSAFLLSIIPAEKSARLNLIAAAISGVLMGISVLTRGYLVFVVLALPLYLLTFKKSKKTALICLIFSIMLPFGWMIRNALVLNSFTLSTETAQVIWHGNNLWSRGGWNGEWSEPDSGQKAYLLEKYPGFFEMSETARSKIYMEEAVKEITGNPSRVLRLIPRKIAVFLNPKSYLGIDWVYLSALPFALYGFFLLWRDKEQRHKLWFLAFPVLSAAIVCVITFGDTRFRHPVDFCFIMLASVGIAAISEKLRVSLFGL